SGCLTNLSLSGAFIKGGVDVRVLSRIQVVIEVPSRFKHATPIVSAYVARKFKDGIGVEWCEFAPQAVIDLIRSVSPRRFVPLRSAGTPGTSASAVRAPLLKHGS